MLSGPLRARLILLGVLGMCIAQVTQTVGVELSTASDISLLATTTPLWMALLGLVVAE